MKKILLFALPLFLLTVCTEADRVSNNLSQEADSFNITRKLTVSNANPNKKNKIVIVG
ncbi:TPA: hypothetical protein TXI91_000885 [Streptococcus suis]|uniref:beta-sandwich lipoprotein n=1 Tax=Streptococcus suis TaxID=1307 RepID=UPI002A85F934|nr:hypothetical protein [Streptococcus suis]HEL1552625.1 hypothetical protein [Streptococcus suis]HEM2763815.1 hypothetical protein [Streptococcus suis]